MLWSTCNVLTAIGQIKFNHIGTQQGLSQSTAFNIFQDSRGFLWFATSDGLNKYDGYRFTVYRHEFDKPNSISSSNISCITEDFEGNLWIGTINGGVNKLEVKTGKFIRYDSDKYHANIGNRSISGIIATRDHKIWAATYGYGLLTIDLDKNSVSWRLSEAKQLTTYDITKLYYDKKGNIWIGGHYGVMTMIDPAGKAQTFRLENELPPQKNQINCLFEEANGDLLVGTRGNGLYKFDSQSKQFVRLLYNPAVTDKENIITSMVRDKQGILWIGTDSGVLLVQNANYKNPTRLQANPDEENGLSSFSIISLFVDKDNNVWIGTWEGGLNVHYRRHSRFALYRHQSNKTQSLLSNKVTSISCENNDKIWIGSNNGLTLLDRTTNQFKHFINDPETAKIQNNNDIVFLLHDRDGDMFVGVWGIGLRLLRKGSSVFEDYMYAKGSFGTHISAICTTSQPNKVWLGTQGDGVLLFDKQTKTFTPIRELNKVGLLAGIQVNSLMEDVSGVLWVGSYDNGVFTYNTRTKQVRHFSQTDTEGSLRGTSAYRIFQDSKKRIWIGTNGGGLNLYNPQKQNFSVLTKTDGLPNNTVKGIMEDGHQNLWLATNEGLAVYDTKNKTFRNFAESDGLQGKEFLINAYAKNQRGEMFFGGTGGLNIFHPDSLKGRDEVPQVYITGLKLFNKTVEIGEDSPLQQDIAFTQEITFKSSENVITFEYVALDFQQLKNNQYAYQLEGFDEDWNFVNKQRSAIYTNLSPGEYTFKVKVTNSDGVWNEHPTTLKVIVLPPWYRTWWAYSIYFLMLIAGLITLRRMIEIRERFKSDLRLKEKEKEQIRELDRLKTNFFTNISHEFRTPLTLIISPLERFFSENPQLPEKQKTQFNLIYRNAKQLLKLINQLLDLSKLEAGKFTPEISQNDLVEFLEKILSSFKALAEHKHIQLDFTKNSTQLMAYYDADIVEKVISNLLSNAFKYTPEQGKITLDLQVIYDENNQPQKVQLQVIDTGLGIKSEHLSQIFNRFYQVQESGQPQVVGTGVGLALCKELTTLHRGEISVASTYHKGCTFTVVLPIAKDAFDRNWFKDHGTSQPIEVPVLPKTTPKTQNPISEDKPILLLAEDNDELREYIAEIFKENFQVIEANNGQTAWQQAQQCIPDLIISDWMMPQMTGIDFCHLVKENEKTSHIPVIILTSKSNHESKIVGWEKGADDYITKPFNANLLEARVKNLLEIRRKLRERFSQEVEIQPKEITLNSADEHFLEKAIRIVEENLENSAFDIQQLEVELKMSNMQLYRKLKSLTNLSGNEFIRSIRLKRAVQLLETNSFTVSEIAYKVGFNDPSYFTRIFKKEYGMSPTEMRDKVKEL